MTALVAGKIKPSRAAQAVSHAARAFPENQNSPPLLSDYPAIKLSDLVFAAQNEHATSLADILLRRVGAGWTPTMAHPEAETAAKAVAGAMGWDERRAASEVEAYRVEVERLFRPRLNVPVHTVEPQTFSF